MAHHHHEHSPANYGRAFAIGVSLNLGFVLLELILGNSAHSLALIGDAAHNFGDVFALLLAWGATLLVRRRATQHYTYGLRRASILAALINSMLLLVITGGIAWEAIRRFSQPDAVSGGTMMWVAAVGIVVNAVTAYLFYAGRKNDLNIRGAFLHMAADAAVSLGVVITGGALLLTGWPWLDPVISLIISAVILVGTWGLLARSVSLALDGVPEGIDTVRVRDHLAKMPGVVAVHDLHIWGMSTTEAALTAHLVMKDVSCDDNFLVRATCELHDSFGIEHVTLQRELSDLAQQCNHCESVIPVKAS